jgi:multiple sugar transport system permease protein
MAVADVMMLPPVIIFAVLNRHSSAGRIGGALTGR